MSIGRHTRFFSQMRSPSVYSLRRDCSQERNNHYVVQLSFEGVVLVKWFVKDWSYSSEKLTRRIASKQEPTRPFCYDRSKLS